MVLRGSCFLLERSWKRRGTQGFLFFLQRSWKWFIEVLVFLLCSSRSGS